MKGEGKGPGLLIALGPPKDGEGESSAKDDACKAMWDALKEDDYDAFKDALGLYLDERDDESLGGEPEGDDYEAEDE